MIRGYQTDHTAELFLVVFFAAALTGTFPPSSQAAHKPMEIACFGFLTLFHFFNYEGFLVSFLHRPFYFFAGFFEHVAIEDLFIRLSAVESAVW